MREITLWTNTSVSNFLIDTFEIDKSPTFYHPKGNTNYNLTTTGKKNNIWRVKDVFHREKSWTLVKKYQCKGTKRVSPSQTKPDRTVRRDKDMRVHRHHRTLVSG